VSARALTRNPKNSETGPTIPRSVFNSFITEIVGPPGTSKKRKKERHPKKKKTERKAKAGSTDALEVVRASLAGIDAKRAGVLQRLSGRSEGTSSLAGETGWGEDGALSLDFCGSFSPEPVTALRPSENVDYEPEECSDDHDHDRESMNESVQRGPPPHMGRHPLTYTRRVEGIFDDVRHPNASSSSKQSSVNVVLEGSCHHLALSTFETGFNMCVLYRC
jgi:hypothetical protein